MPYDSYKPSAQEPKTQIEIMQPDGSLQELSTISPIVQALAGRVSGDHRFYFPKEMLADPTHSQTASCLSAFQAHIKNNALQ